MLPLRGSGPMERGECNNRDPLWFYTHPRSPPALREVAAGIRPDGLGMAWGWWDLRGCRRERGGKTRPRFPRAPAREEEDSQGCLGTVGTARVGAQGEGGEFLKNSINQTKALGAGRGSSSRQVLPASLTTWDGAKTPHFERHKPFNGVF